MITGFLIWPTFCRSQVKVQNSTNIVVFHYYLTWNILTLCEHVSRHHLPFNQISARSDFKYGCQVEKKQSAIITPELMAGSAPNCYHRYIYNVVDIHDIIPGFFICPIFVGRRGQSSKCHHYSARFNTI
jgi:hypothetical protein